MSTLKRQVNSSSDISSFFSVITYNSSVSLQLIHFLPWAKGSHENTNFDIFKCLDENLPKFLMSFLKPQVSFSSNFAWFFSVMKYTPLYFFRSNVYFAQKGPKCKFFRLFSARIKIHQILVIFETKISFSSNFAPLFGIMRHISSILFLAETLYTFSKSSLSK